MVIDRLLNALDFNLKFNGDKNNSNASNKYSLKIFFITVIVLSIVCPLVRSVLWRSQTKAPYSTSQDLILLTEYIKSNTNANDKIFVWGWYPDIYVLTKRDPASRYIYRNFLTGLIPTVNADPNIDTSKLIIPGSWQIFMEEIKKNMPRYFVDTSPGDHKLYGNAPPGKFYQKYPPDKFSQLSIFLKENYVVVKEFFSEKGTLAFNVFKRMR